MAEPKTKLRSQNCDLIVRNGVVLSMNAKRTVYAPGAIAIAGNKILAVGPEREVAAHWEARRVIDARGAPVHPGFVDCHYHLTIHLARGVVPDDPKANSPFGYGDWFRHLQDDDEYVQAQFVGLEMLRHGYTFFLEPGTVFSPDAAAAGAESVGVRGSLGDPFLWDVADGGNTLPALVAQRAPCSRAHALATLGKQVKRNADPNARIRGHVAIYGSGSQSEDLMRAAKDCADANGVVFNMHHNFMPEHAARDDRRFGGRSSMVSFAEKGLLGRNAAFVHMNVIRDDEMKPIVESGMSLVWQPGNYMYYGVHDRCRGRMAEVIERGGNVAFGVDTAKIWTFGDLELIGYLVARQTGRYISTEKILEMRTIDGARAACVDHLVGSLEPGKRADIVIRDSNSPEAAPGVNAVQEMLLGAQSSAVRTVLVDGEIVFNDGHATRVDQAAVVAAGRETARRVLARAGFTPQPRWPVIG